MDTEVSEDVEDADWLDAEDVELTHITHTMLLLYPFGTNAILPGVQTVVFSKDMEIAISQSCLVPTSHGTTTMLPPIPL